MNKKILTVLAGLFLGVTTSVTATSHVPSDQFVSAEATLVKDLEQPMHTFNQAAEETALLGICIRYTYKCDSVHPDDPPEPRGCSLRCTMRL